MVFVLGGRAKEDGTYLVSTADVSTGAACDTITPAGRCSARSAPTTEGALEARIIEVYLLLLAGLGQNICKTGGFAGSTLLLMCGLLLGGIAACRLDDGVARRRPHRRPAVALPSLMPGRPSATPCCSLRRSIYYDSAGLLAFGVGYGVHFQGQAHI